MHPETAHPETAHPETEHPETVRAPHAVEPGVLPHLRCPACRASLTQAGDHLRCPLGHAYGTSRAGDVDLRLAGRGRAPSAAAVFESGGRLGRGPARDLARLVAQLLLHSDAAAGHGPVVETGHARLLATVLDQLPGRSGLTTAGGPGRTHPRGCGVRLGPAQALPLADATAGVVLHGFAGAETAEAQRILSPGGLLVVAMPTAAHLAELVRPLAVLGVTRRRPSHAVSDIGGLRRRITRVLTTQVSMDRDGVAALVSVDPALLPRFTARTVTVSVRVSVYRAGSAPLASTSLQSPGAFQAVHGSERLRSPRREPYPTAAAACRPAIRPEKRQPPRNVPSNER